MEPHVLNYLARATVMVVLIVVVTQQCRRPTWWPGRLVVWIMNRSHATVTAWGLGHVELERDFTILDVGCGGGMAVHTLAGIATEGRVYGIDYSTESVATARRVNAPLIEAGRVDIRQGTVSSLPYPDATFDIVTAIETHYYWPNPVADVREVLRVLKPGGRLVLVAETYKGRRFDTLYRPAMKLLRATYLTLAEHDTLLATAGYSDVQIFEERRKGWICAVGRRPV